MIIAWVYEYTYCIRATLQYNPRRSALLRPLLLCHCLWISTSSLSTLR